MSGAETARRRVVQRRIGGAETAAPKWPSPHFFNQNIANTTITTTTGESSCCWNFTNWLSFFIIVQRIANLLDIFTGKIGSGAAWSPAVQILDRGLFIPLSHYFLNTSFAHWSFESLLEVYLTLTNRLTLYNSFNYELSLIGWQASHLDKLWSGEEWRLTIL